MTLGERIRKYRTDAGLTLEQLSELSHVEVGTIHALETRKSQRSRFTAALARALGVDMADLVSDANADHRVAEPAAGRYVRRAPPAKSDPEHSNNLSQLSSREVDVVLALRAVSQSQRDRFIADLMKVHEEQNPYASQTLSRYGARGPVSDERAAEALPGHPDGIQRDSEHGKLA